MRMQGQQRGRSCSAGSHTRHCHPICSIPYPAHGICLISLRGRLLLWTVLHSMHTRRQAAFSQSQGIVAVSRAESLFHAVRRTQAQLEECCSKLLKAEARVRQMQEHNNEAAKAQVKRFLPQDFRMSMLEMRQSHQVRSLGGNGCLGI